MHTVTQTMSCTRDFGGRNLQNTLQVSESSLREQSEEQTLACSGPQCKENVLSGIKEEELTELREWVGNEAGFSFGDWEVRCIQCRGL